MKRISILIMILILFSIKGHAQYTWINPQPQGNTLNSVCFTDEHFGCAVGNYGVIMSTTDGGSTWNILNSNTTLKLNCVIFITSNYGFAVGDSGIIINTTDRGASWSTLSSGITSNLLSVFFTDSLHGYSCGSNGSIIKTSNGGHQWDICVSNATTNLYSIDFPTKRTGFIVGGGGQKGGPGSVLKSEDGGNSWTLLSDSLPESLYSTDFVDSLTGYAAGNFGYVIKTVDGGKHWNTLNLTNTDAFHLHFIKFINSKTGFACGVGGQIEKTVDGGQTWKEVSINLFNHFYSIGQINDSSICVVGSGGITLVSKDYGMNFSNSQNGNTYEQVSICKTDDKSIFVIGNGTLFKTSDGGVNWGFQNVPELKGSKSAKFLNSLVGFVLTASGIYKTTNAGLSWVKCSLPVGGYYDLYNICMINESQGFAVGGGRSPGFTTWGKLLKTTDGLNWTILPDPSYSKLSKVYFKNNSTGYMLVEDGGLLTTNDAGNNWSYKRLSVFYLLNDIVFINENIGFIIGYSFDKGNIIYKTVNGGANWDTIYEDHNINYVNAFKSFCFADSLTGYAVGSNGYIVKTNDGGISWTSQQGFTDNVLNSIELVNKSSGYIIGYNGTFASFGDLVSGIMVPNSNLSNIVYSYPNPFDETIQFELYCNIKDIISIELYDIQGRLVEKVNRKVLQGKQIINLNLHLEKGTYIYTIKGKEIFNTGKIIKGEK